MGTCDTVDRTDVQRLAELELFAGADRDLLAAMADRSMALDLEKGRELVREGSVAREFVVILDGHAVVTIGGVPISYIGAGSCFGEMSLIDGSRRSATVTAASAMRIVVFNRDDFLELLTQQPAFCVRVLTMVVGRLRLADAKLAERAGTGSGTPSPVSVSARSGVPAPAGGGAEPVPGGRTDQADGTTGARVASHRHPVGSAR
jgi:CRP-like cAMP-binding protein